MREKEKKFEIERLQRIEEHERDLKREEILKKMEDWEKVKAEKEAEEAET